MRPVSWSDVAGRSLSPVLGGFTDAERGLLDLGDQAVFVKKGRGGSVPALQKEVAVYRFLGANDYQFAPELLAAAPDGSGLVLPSLADWDWSPSWPEGRLDATVEAVERLAGLTEAAARTDLFAPLLDENGWAVLAADPARYEALEVPLDLGTAVRRAARFESHPTTLVHLDVRADNAPWSASLQEVRLLDWNWAAVSDPRIDWAVTLTHAYRQGADLGAHAALLDQEALHFMLGYWLMAASRPAWVGEPPGLRAQQLATARSGLELLD